MSAWQAGELLRAAGFTLATAESLTGGTVGARITSVPGASDYYLGGVIAYSAAIKHSVLHVGQDIIDAHGVVSTQTAAAMATGARALFGSSLGVATTGVAGPDPLEGQPAGTLCLAVADQHGTEAVRLAGPGGDRAAVISWAADQAIALLIKRLTSLQSPGDESSSRR
jgi:nicotinamide-nucleotide amidase